MSDHTVLWDGRRDGPGGAHLFADEPVPVERPIRRRVYGGLTERMRQVRGQCPEWFTQAQLAALAGCSVDEARNSVGGLVRAGELKGRYVRDRRGWGGMSLVYRWTT